MTGSGVSAGRPDAGLPTFASGTVDAGFVSANCGFSRGAGVDRASAFAAVPDLGLAVAALDLDDAGAASVDRLVAILPAQPNPFGSAHASMLACCDKGQLQPTRVAARTPMRSTLMLIPS
jgi:hypothetical protein